MAISERCSGKFFQQAVAQMPIQQGPSPTAAKTRVCALFERQITIDHLKLGSGLSRQLADSFDQYGGRFRCGMWPGFRFGSRARIWGA
jgi:hypothetical protein